MNTPLISIVIPCYNAERFVGEAIRSALSQTYTHTEVIVVDDGSTDNSRDIITSFGPQVSAAFTCNRGGSEARNLGVEMARGELVQFLDADDVLMPAKCERHVSALEASANSVVYFSRARYLDGAPFSRPVSANCRKDSVQLVLRTRIQTSAPLHWKKHLVAIGGFDKSLPCAQERDLHVRLACNGVEFAEIPEVLYMIRPVPGSVSSSLLRVLDQHERIILRARDLLVARGELTRNRAHALAAFLYKDARRYLGHGKREQAEHYRSLAHELYPGGGADLAYGPVGRLLSQFFGFTTAERLIQFRRRTGSATSDFTER